MSKVALLKNKRLHLLEDVDQKQLRLRRKSIHQKEARENVVNKRRGLRDGSDEETTSSNNDNVVLSKRQQLLQKWKEEKLLKKKLDAEKKKPVFKISSSINYNVPAILNNQKSEKVHEKPGIVTRGMAKALITGQKQPSVTNANSKVNENVTEGASKTSRQQFKVPKLFSKLKSTTTHNASKPVSKPVPTATLNVPGNDDEQINHNVSKQSRKSFAPDNFQFIAPGNLSTYSYTSISSTDPDKDNMLDVNMKRFKLKSPTNVGENQTQKAPLSLGKSKVFNESSIFSPVADNESVADVDKDNMLVVNIERFKDTKRGNKDMSSTQMRENKNRTTPLSLVKTKALDESSIFSPVSDTEFDSIIGVVDKPRRYAIQETENSQIVKLSERQSFLQQMSTRENIIVANSIFSPLKLEFSNAHGLANKENATN